MGLNDSTLKQYRAILDAYNEGLGVKEIQEKLEISRTAVYRGFKHLGIKPERDAAKALGRVIPLFEAGLSRREIASQTHYSYAHVCLVIQSHQAGNGLAIRPRAMYKPKPYVLPEIDPIWAAEFRGFFYGEGCAMIGNANSHFRPILTINLRDDDQEILKEIHGVLGGSLYFKKRKLPDHDQCSWHFGGWEGCRAVIEELGFIEERLMPAHKLRDIEIMYEAILYRYSIPYLLTSKERAVLADFHLRLREVKRYQL